MHGVWLASNLRTCVIEHSQTSVMQACLLFLPSAQIVVAGLSTGNNGIEFHSDTGVQFTIKPEGPFTDLSLIPASATTNKATLTAATGLLTAKAATINGQVGRLGLDGPAPACLSRVLVHAASACHVLCTALLRC